MNSFIFLYLENYGIRKLEAFFAVLITSMAISFAWMFVDTEPSGRELMEGEAFQFSVFPTGFPSILEHKIKI